MDNRETNLKPLKIKTRYGHILSAKILNRFSTPFYILKIQDALSPKTVDINFASVAKKKDASHVILSLMGRDVKNPTREYLMMYCFKTQQKIMLNAPAEVFAKRREYLKLEYYSYKI